MVFGLHLGSLFGLFLFFFFSKKQFPYLCGSMTRNGSIEQIKPCGYYEIGDKIISRGSYRYIQYTAEIHSDDKSTIQLNK